MSVRSLLSDAPPTSAVERASSISSASTVSALLPTAADTTTADRSATPAPAPQLATHSEVGNGHAESDVQATPGSQAEALANGSPPGSTSQRMSELWGTLLGRRTTDDEGGGTWVSRVQAKNEELRQLFDLPDTENVLEDFHCALQSKILLQGRMYVFEHHVCFFANIFGYIKNKVIPLKEVTAVRKRKNVGFPNSIEIIWRGGKREFFTSFLSREEAYRLIMLAWHRSSDYAKLFTGQSDPNKLPLPKSVKRHRRSSSSSVQDETRLAALVAGSTAARQLDSAASRRPYAPQAAEQDGNASVERRAGSVVSEGAASPDTRAESLVQGSVSSAGRLREMSLSPLVEPIKGFLKRPFTSTKLAKLMSSANRNSSSDLDESLTPAPKAHSADSLLGMAQPEGSNRRSIASQPSDDMGTVDEDEEISRQGSLADSTDAEEETWTAVSLTAPEPDDDMTQLVDEVIEGADVLRYCAELLADSSSFYANYHTARGDKDVHITKWRRHLPLGKVRELQFITPLKSRMGPPQTICHQTQRQLLYAGDHLVFESSQVMPDIPYGDCFTVEARWDVRRAQPVPGAAPRTSVQSRVKVVFNKSTMFKRMIEKGVIDSCGDAHRALVGAARKVLAPPPPPARSLARGRAESRVLSEPDIAKLNQLLEGVDPQHARDISDMLQLTPTAKSGQEEGEAGSQSSGALQQAGGWLQGAANSARAWLRTHWLTTVALLLAALLLWQVSASLWPAFAASGPAFPSWTAVRHMPRTEDSAWLKNSIGSAGGGSDAAQQLQQLQAEVLAAQQHLQALSSRLAGLLHALELQLQQKASSGFATSSAG